jgi:uncharacterized membrane protein YkvA (DUF1232 family)
MGNSFSRYFNEPALMAKIRKFYVKAGQKVIYAVLLLYYVFKSPGVNMKTKLTIVAALGYFIVPVDAIFDLAPVLGFTDDFGILIYTLVRISSLITPEIKLQARHKMNEWFPKIDTGQLVAVEDKFL